MIPVKSPDLRQCVQNLQNALEEQRVLMEPVKTNPFSVQKVKVNRAKTQANADHKVFVKKVFANISLKQVELVRFRMMVGWG